MTNWEAFWLGLLQGLTEFLPVSSSGHLEIGKALLGVDVEKDLTFTIVVHGATVLATIIVFWKEIAALLNGFFKFRWNEETQYIAKLLISMIPVAIIGVFFKEEVESLFGNGLMLVAAMLLLTAALLTFSSFAKPRHGKISFWHSFVIGISQAVAILPGLSRSGTTIATGLLLGNKKEQLAQFSFLMVLIPILGENILDLLKGDFTSSSVGTTPLLIGFLTAFASGLIACKWMINIVKKGKLIYFAIYCVLVAAAIFIFG